MNPFDPKPKPTNPLRLQQRAPRFDRTQGDNVVIGFDRALREAQRRAEREQHRQVVTVVRYAPVRLGGDVGMRVQAWR